MRERTGPPNRWTGGTAGLRSDTKSLTGTDRSARMTFLIHNHRYEGSELHSSLERPNMRIEHRSLNSGSVLPRVTCTCNAVTIALAGRTPVRWKEAVASRRMVAVQPGIASILPLGFDEPDTEIVSPL